MKYAALLFLLAIPNLSYAQIDGNLLLGKWFLSREYNSKTALLSAQKGQTVALSTDNKALFSVSGSTFSFDWELKDSTLTLGRSSYTINRLSENILILEHSTGNQAGNQLAYHREGKEGDNDITAYFLAMTAKEPAKEPAKILQNTAEPKGSSQQTSTDEEQDKVLKVVEVQPTFPGCEEMGDRKSEKICADEKMLTFIYGNIKYPAEARAAKVQGMVVITFVVEKDGTITHATITRDIGKGCGEEALKVVESMPKWNPGLQRGEPVRVQYNIPIKFKLE
jgi:TonB family protein